LRWDVFVHGTLPVPRNFHVVCRLLVRALFAYWWGSILISAGIVDQDTIGSRGRPERGNRRGQRDLNGQMDGTFGLCRELSNKTPSPKSAGTMHACTLTSSKLTHFCPTKPSNDLCILKPILKRKGGGKGLHRQMCPLLVVAWHKAYVGMSATRESRVSANVPVTVDGGGNRT
jgi:hypothetical protein